MVQTYLQANPDSSRVPPHRQLVRDVNKLQAEAGQAKHRPASDCEPHDGDACSCSGSGFEWACECEKGQRV